MSTLDPPPVTIVPLLTRLPTETNRYQPNDCSTPCRELALRAQVTPHATRWPRNQLYNAKIDRKNAEMNRNRWTPAGV